MPSTAYQKINLAAQFVAIALVIAGVYRSRSLCRVATDVSVVNCYEVERHFVHSRMLYSVVSILGYALVLAWFWVGQLACGWASGLSYFVMNASLVATTSIFYISLDNWINDISEMNSTAAMCITCEKGHADWLGWLGLGILSFVTIIFIPCICARQKMREMRLLDDDDDSD